ncbi:OmpA family protein [Labilibaculum sp. A4]|uniref:OmpA family protein n=1 Tax=Labilibaculum euxinus TaxID=2686357 RepID=UPI000F61EB5B|nr:OmpA family protein [Labilibaculum euxinus]MDQ1772036.1 OmpA family protein [Labilibaculum euxinus]MWN75530.1 OmpA family protein [Labilibaculum euxinus]
MKKYKIQVLIGFSLFVFGSVKAQKADQFLSLDMSSGLHSMQYSLQNGKAKRQFGYGFHLSYSYFLNSHWGVQTGIGMQKCRTEAILNYQSSTSEIDSDGDSYEFRNRFDNWQEKQDVFFVDIPLSLQYQKMLGKKFGILAGLGAQISIPAQATYETTGGEMVTTAYYSQWNVELYDLPQHGLGSITTKYKGDISLNPSYSAIAELDGFYQVSEKIDVYAGCYCNYGFNNLISPEKKIVYQPDGVYNGILASDQVSKVNLLAFGLKVGVRFRINKVRRRISKKTGSMNEVQTAEYSGSLLPAGSVKEELGIESAKTGSMNEVQTTEHSGSLLPADSVKEELDIEPAKSEIKTSVNKEETPIEKARQISDSMNLEFSFNSIELIKEQDSNFQILSNLLKENQEIQLQIIGHTCNIADYETNMIVGLRRAEYVKSKLIELGVPPFQMEIESRGLNEPLFENTSEENRVKNRRVEIKVISK